MYMYIYTYVYIYVYIYIYIYIFGDMDLHKEIDIGNILFVWTYIYIWKKNQMSTLENRASRFVRVTWIGEKVVLT